MAVIGTCLEGGVLTKRLEGEASYLAVGVYRVVSGGIAKLEKGVKRHK